MRLKHGGREKIMHSNVESLFTVKEMILLVKQQMHAQ